MNHYMVVVKVRERLAVCKQTTYRFHMKRFSLKKLNELESKDQHHVEISNRFSALVNLDADVDINRENIQISAKESKLHIFN
jgi:hypothetical protein